MFRSSTFFDRLHRTVLVFDAAGLALFVASGTLIGLQAHLNPVGAIVLGALSGIGGGLARDLLLAEVPTVLRSELYAVAALAGATVVAGGQLLQLPSVPVTIAGALLCFGLRMAAIRRGWHLPVLAERLAFLVNEAILDHRDGRYALTDKGLALWPVLRTLAAWGDAFCAPDGPRRIFRHATCDTLLTGSGTCPTCHGTPPPDELDVLPGPGLAAGPARTDAVSAALSHPHRLLEPLLT